MKASSTASLTAIVLAFMSSACGNQSRDAAVDNQMSTEAGTDYSLVTPAKANEQELPTWQIPNMPESAEAYYGPDSYHVIAQTQDPDAVPPSHARAAGGALTWITTDDGKMKWRVNDHGQDACSFILPDGKHLVFTSTRDNMDVPVGNWSDETDYPQGAELYMSDLDGSNLKRLTNNDVYDAEISVSPDGQRIAFTRQIDGKLDIWMMNADGTGEKQLTFTDDWQEGAPFFLPDSKTITMRAWKRSERDKSPTRMTIFTLDTDTGEIVVRTHDDWMNWAPYPTPDGKHYVFVRPLLDNPMNWEIFLGDLDGGEPVRLTYNDSFDGFPAVSPDGTKMVFTRSIGERFMSDLYTFVMDISSLNVGPASK
jgi:TolB protein